jgi:hypothetical protein
MREGGVKRSVFAYSIGWGLTGLRTVKTEVVNSAV